MGTESYILAGTETAMEKTFGSTCHGAGRRMSRTQAKKQFRGETLVKLLEQKGIIVRGHSMPGIAEEAPEAYKDVREVVDSVHALEISRKVVRLVPLGVVKG
jgi:tRNA-splicing ligase RtcB